MRECFAALIFCVVFIAFPGFYFYRTGYETGIVDGEKQIGRALLKDCEEPLPRTQKCVLTAVPETTDTQEKE